VRRICEMAPDTHLRSTTTTTKYLPKFTFNLALHSASSRVNSTTNSSRLKCIASERVPNKKSKVKKLRKQLCQQVIGACRTRLIRTRARSPIQIAQLVTPDAAVRSPTTHRGGCAASWNHRAANQRISLNGRRAGMYRQRRFVAWKQESSDSQLTQILGSEFLEWIGGPGRDRTDDLFHAMEARSQLRHRPTFAKGKTLIIFDE
jgi:hypothetical protein